MSHCVYFIRAFYTGKVQKRSFGFVNWKIGRTFNIDRRVRTFQTACPVPLEVVGTLTCPDRTHAIRIERDLHDYFADSRLSGEWFSFDYHQTRVIHALIEAWPIGNSLESFAECLPKYKASKTDPKLDPTHRLIPLAAHLSERKALKARIQTLQQSQEGSELVAQLRMEIQKLKADNTQIAKKAGLALNYLTSKYAGLITAFKGQSTSSFLVG